MSLTLFKGLFTPCLRQCCGNVAESVLSQAIPRLESSVGEQLCIRRKSRGLQLTPAGERFAVRARGLLKDAGDLLVEMSGETGELKGAVKVGCFAIFAAGAGERPAGLGHRLRRGAATWFSAADQL